MLVAHKQTYKNTSSMPFQLNSKARLQKDLPSSRKPKGIDNKTDQERQRKKGRIASRAIRVSKYNRKVFTSERK